MTKEFICVACPLGCGLKVELGEGGEIISVSGNTCKRGEAYAKTELTNPTRMFHSTVKVAGGREPLVPCKSSAPVPKAKLMDFARATFGVTAQAPVGIGDILAKDVCGTGIDLLATNRIN